MVRAERETGSAAQWSLPLSWIRSFRSQALGTGEACGESQGWGTRLFSPKVEQRPSSIPAPLFVLEFSLRNMHSRAFRAGSLGQLRT